VGSLTHSIVQITIGIGNEVRDSTVQLSQMVSVSNAVKITLHRADVSSLERCICGDIGDPWRDISENEQHGDTTGMSVVMVHRIFNHRVLVLPRRVVVSTVTIHSALFDTRFENWNHRLSACQYIRLEPCNYGYKCQNDEDETKGSRYI
jgi:hypothetical protein